MNSGVRYQIQEIPKQIDNFEVGDVVKSYGNGGSALKNGNVLLYFDEKTLEINRLGIEIPNIDIGTTEHYIKLRKQEKNFLTKAFKKKLSIFNIEREEKRIKEEKKCLDQIKFNDNEKSNDI